MRRDRPLELVDEGVDLLVGRGPVERAPLVFDDPSSEVSAE